MLASFSLVTVLPPLTQLERCRPSRRPRTTRT